MSSGQKRGRIKPSARRSVYTRDKYTCQHCGKKCKADAPEASFYAPTIDHVIPYSISFNNLQSNLVTSCFPCNNEKGDNMEWEYEPIPPKIGLAQTITLPPHLAALAQIGS